ncbi:response regulator transcription factor [uncultured Arcticibacterium sp.]|uniref:response regulator transcription factor n=1 Tax=uncultured Arcticibacterium sp. TaxID=2173042 RepID=UPI0030FCE1BE
MTTALSTKILVLSNQLLYIEALKSLLNSQDTFSADGIPTSNTDLCNSIGNFSPELILMDANGMGKDIWETLNKIHKKLPNVKIIMLANSNESIYIEFAKKNGASGFILKSSPLELLLAAIKIIQNGSHFFDTRDFTSSNNKTELSLEKRYKLSGREMEIITLITDANTTKSIADQLGLSFHTIEAHRKNIYKKLRINKVTELIKLTSEFEN